MYLSKTSISVKIWKYRSSQSSKYSEKARVKRPLKNKQNKDLNDKW